MREKLIIPVSGWLHREGAFNSSLLRVSDGKRCCLGIYIQDNCGVSPNELMDQSSPRQLPEALKEKLPAWLYSLSDDSALCESLMAANDNPWARERDVRLAILALFDEVGVEVEFIEDRI